MKLPLKLATAALLFACTATPPSAFAQSTTGGLWFAMPGETPAQSSALSTFDLLSVPAESDGSRTFSVDVMYGDDAASIGTVGFEVHMESEKMELVSVENLAVAGLSPEANPMSLLQVSYADFRSFVGRDALDDGDMETDSLIYPTWGSILGPTAFFFGTATLAAPVRMMTLNFKWKGGVAGNANLNFAVNSAVEPNVDDYTLTSLAVQGPPLA
ncbi:MAG: hypothetical protein MPK62_12865, partial [Alphaproteobacteria bacterium]|nr:hypothetical protein [Alphaproteobacteria bacterium]